MSMITQGNTGSLTSNCLYPWVTTYPQVLNSVDDLERKAMERVIDAIRSVIGKAPAANMKDAAEALKLLDGIRSLRKDVGV